ncbi:MULTISPECIES: outer membrane lipoprotein chaperone LolA [Pseudomonas]|jgi:outer membrane lipoprotein carrier protein|uniref:Outer-membrane lipoprotein carrier protein n=1 Tax=Pseudomonas coleopterorum TaxID=1605838 RepID=A0AAJ6LWP7_9PSED|nr:MULTISPECIES: outer membrane lipoprotein chaperone LolA [Pseudomonas]KNC16191.1 membrane protein [Pseudomonas sp. RIT-PI-a]KQQ63140.1 outer membrane lipoprotein carrier protein LolA [Pseudomonas sp. Leaf129]MBD8480034.1 outer membrane lipoprotein chaperone LolA [Pseudomonas coleopterorum]MDY1016226.1 outer membrane lipoprotein chaperone LolA [Pseudomonas coleopterorum]MDY1045987.1 outer membrane lipoprotein chaperone LolA [Pseudomonas coleopterorum]
MRLIRMLLVSALALSSLSVHADQKDVARLTQLLEKSQTLTARFSQLTLDGSGTQLQETAGEMALQRPGLFNWHTDAPQEQLMVSDGKKVSLWDPDLEQVTIKNLDQRLTQTPALLLSGDVSKISQSFDISAKEAGDVIDFVLKPKTRDTLFDSLRLSFRKGMINDMQLIDSVGQRTNILFMNVKANEPIAASKFKFDIPKGADVIQE